MYYRVFSLPVSHGQYENKINVQKLTKIFTINDKNRCYESRRLKQENL